MKTTSLTVAALASTAAAQLEIAALLASLGPAPADDPRFTNYTPPGAGDVRSPCPGLNTLANHGFIPHNGRGMTIPVLLVGLAQGMNMGADFTTAIGGAGLLSSPDPFAGSFALNDLDQHNFPIEHDASLSRQDAYFGNDYSFYNPNWQKVLSYYKGRTYTDIKSSSDARYGRYNDSLTRNPIFTFGAREFVLAYGESALYLQTMSSPLSDGVARIDWIREMFEKEKLPYDLGWRPSAEPITLASLGEQVLQLYSAGPEPLPEGLEITAHSYKDLFEGIVGGSEILANLTDGISSAVGL
ncbi:putative sterigmatocystin biosynthesis peroxidase stcC [Teratosphaeria destructans]|uniref:Sterigmatocystin biosynthesis peroxidase stcC n=1 Tax=Teratosphaeria destructans TaxID=418781 RepID=A0A9W7ST92_9PEZI|nr:putative sterigmatocystin biosynthesis peroxidase stcC [Teratosphaeria destructans]